MAERGKMQDVDFAKITRECLKSLTGEDLFHLYYFYSDEITDFEKKYNNISGITFENEMAKILLRIRNEGKPDIQNESKKQVRFEERGSAVNHPVGGEQLRGDRIWDIILFNIDLSIQ